MNYMGMYERWLGFDEETKKELSNLSESEIKDRFYRELEFGTGGLRGVIAAGTNRMNVYTIRRATAGLANYILKLGIENPSVAIAYDSRKNSDIFAQEAALVLNGYGIKTYIYDELKPTPMLSYAVRNLKATSGIVITASHNPKEYNGYKVYWNDGGQITEEHAAGILSEISKVDYENISIMEFDKAREEGLFNLIPREVEDAYIELVKGLIINKDVIARMGKDLKVIYTPIHGSGNKPIRRVLTELGFENLSVVKEQEEPDCNFSTVKYPNPEESEVFTLAIEMAKKNNADIIIGTDPDCDRVGVVAKDKTGEYVVLTGNQVGILLTNYMLNQLKALDKMPENPIVIKTIVTTELTKKICDEFNVEMIDVLTGFKYIGEKIKEFEEKNSNNFIIGFEESYGYLAGTFVRDKDAVIASALICEMAAFYKERGMSLYDGLTEIYERHGYSMESLQSFTMKGIDGAEEIKSIMKNLRDNTPDALGKIKVVVVKDYLLKKEKNIETGVEKDINLPKSNVIQLILEDGSIITARPSGTEPKIKFYFASFGNSQDECNEIIETIKKDVLNLIG